MGAGPRSAWMGHWRAPWTLEKGRRFGDTAWGAAAIAQAWLLGGREGRWPRAAWSGRRPEGPRPGPVGGFDATPDPAFVALLRHGSADAPAALPGKPGWAFVYLECGACAPL